MKICMVGSHRVGKTTLAERLGVELELKMVYTKLSDVIKLRHGLTTGEAYALHGEDGFYRRLNIQDSFATHIENLLLEPNIITDRSLFDVAAYSEESLARIITECELGTKFIKILNAHVRLLNYHAEKYGKVDFFVYVRPGIEFDPDQKSWNYLSQKWIDNILEEELKTIERPERLIEVPSEILNLEERVDYVCEEIARRTA